MHTYARTYVCTDYVIMCMVSATMPSFASYYSNITYRNPSSKKPIGIVGYVVLPVVPST